MELYDAPSDFVLKTIYKENGAEVQFLEKWVGERGIRPDMDGSFKGFVD